MYNFLLRYAVIGNTFLPTPHLTKFLITDPKDNPKERETIREILT
jgi:hypothetical protein